MGTLKATPLGPVVGLSAWESVPYGLLYSLTCEKDYT